MAGQTALFAPAWRIAFPHNDIVRVPFTVLAQSFNGWEGSHSCRNKAYRHADYQIGDWAPSQRFYGMSQPTQDCLCHRGTHGGKLSLWFVLISGSYNKESKSRLVGKPSDRKLSSLVQRALVGLKILLLLNVTA
ncbi:hypothetical protein M9H77_12007 [Catharanthus roseus]|uniref:Uncharacterized protein n=1 Tax=Catharanthus roseus TaxID=4058 RepID=A0ACC0BGA2_CATRO|nr:hypothetical protein M9H77_12007 [Catharanthus roseus]